MNAPISGSAKQKELLPPKQEVSASVDPQRLLPENFHHLYQQWKNGKITGTAAAKLCGMPLSTFAIVRRFTKKPSYCKQVFYRNVYFFAGVF